MDKLHTKFKYELWSKFVIIDGIGELVNCSGCNLEITSYIMDSRYKKYRIEINIKGIILKYIVDEDFLDNNCILSNKNIKVEFKGEKHMSIKNEDCRRDSDVLKSEYENIEDKIEIELLGAVYKVNKEKLLKVLRDNGIIEDKVERFFPKIGEKYTSVERDGGINTYEHDDILPNGRRAIKHNNVFKTIEEAEIKSELNKSVFRMIENLMITENIRTGYIPDYKNDKADKCSFYYSHLDGRWYITHYKNIINGYCTSPKSAEKILKYLKENKIKQ